MAKAIITKLFCPHKWHSHAKTTKMNPMYYMNTEEKLEVVQSSGKTTEVLICDSCGKVKVIRY